jgi:hyperosmotically inducible protein
MKKLRMGILLSAALLAAQLSFAEAPARGASQHRITEEVRRQLVTLPFYSLFDNFTYRVDGDTLTLMGKVSQPTLKSDAEAAVKKIEGVEKVVNEITVLPLSPADDRLRLALYQAIYGNSSLQNLSIRAVPPIHIIVENGHVTLEGVVATDAQKIVAGMEANSVPGIFSVTNNLRLDSKN